jgi:hypothetical protein
MKLSRAKKAISMLRQAGAEEYLFSDFARIVILVWQEGEELRTVLAEPEENAARKLLEMLNDVEFADQNGFSSLFSKVQSSQLVALVREVNEAPVEELKRALIELHIEGRSGFYDFPPAIFPKIAPDFAPSDAQKVLLPYAESCLNLALHLTEQFPRVQFNLWHALAEMKGVIRFLFADRANVSSEMTSIQDPEADFSGCDHVISFGSWGATRLSRDASAHFSSLGYGMLRTETDLLMKRLMNETHSGAHFIIQVPEIFLFSADSFKDIRGHLADNHLLTRFACLSAGTIHPFRHVRMNILEFSNSPKEEQPVEFVLFAPKQSAHSKRNLFVDDLIVSRREINPQNLADRETWDFGSIFLEKATGFVPEIQTIELGHISKGMDIFRGPAMSSPKRAVRATSEPVVLITPSVLGNDIVDVSEIEPIDLGVSKPKKRFFLQDGDIAITCRGTQMKISIIRSSGNIPAVPSENVAVIRVDKEKLDPYFLYTYLMTPTGRQAIEERMSGGTHIVLSVRDLRAVKIPILPLSEQKRIAQEYRDANEWYEAEKKKLDDKYQERIGNVNRMMGLETAN